MNKIILFILISLIFGSCDRDPPVVTDGNTEENQIGGVLIGLQTLGVNTRVIDGDTIEAQIQGKSERLRLLAVNTPERGQPGSKEATAFTKRWIVTHTEHVEFRLNKAGQRMRGKYGHLLVWIVDDQGNVLNVDLIKNGHSKFVRYGHKNLKYEAMMK